MTTENNPTSSDPSASDAPKTLRQKLHWFLWRAAALLGTFLMLMGMLTACAGWYTSRPEFCRSCHNMEPYYVSWQQSSHRDVSCIKCHFPPGAGEKIRGKMLGLVQLAKYVTSSAGPRPAAEIPDESCLRSGCHETRTLSGRIEFQGITFDHRPHLEELRRGKKLRCTSCHSQIVQGTHMTVTTSTCFLCHFKDGHFNEGLGACTRCHQIPDKEFDLGGGVTFHHDLAYERGVDCENCHSDLIGGDGQVPPERCGVCHSRKDDLKRIDDHVFMHKKHVTDHKVDCLACHLQMRHSLDKDRVLHAASDCKSCHPKHHHEQVSMIEATGGKSLLEGVDGNIIRHMDVIGISCLTCHRKKEVSPTGTVLWKASTETCTECHDIARTKEYQAYNEALTASLSDIETSVQQASAAVRIAALSAERSTEITAELKDFQDDVNFLRVGNGIHNIHYASTLTRTIVERLSSICEELKIDPPEVTLPELAKESKRDSGE